MLSMRMGCFSNSLFNVLHHFYHSFHTLVLKCVCPYMASLLRFIATCVNPFWLHLFYFLVMSLVGFLALKMTNMRSSASSRPDDIDMFLTSVSSTTVSSMAFVEMEVFSTSQLVIMTVLMFTGGEVFVSMLALLLCRLKSYFDQIGDGTTSTTMTPYSGRNSNQFDQLELGNKANQVTPKISSPNTIKDRSIQTLSRVLLGYLVGIHLLGSSLVTLYISVTPSARDTLKSKGLNLQTFSIFLIASTFANCGFVPTNENMIVFRKNPGLLLIVLPQILLGNTLFPCCLRFVIWVLEKVQKREEYSYMLNNHKKLGFSHLFSLFDTFMLAATSLGFVAMQFVLFCAMEWWSVGLEGLSVYEKLVGSLFQAMNARHSGESIVDLSTLSKATIVLFVVMMHLPPYTMFIPTWKKKNNQEKGLIIMEEIKEDQSVNTKLQRKSKVLDCMNMILSPFSTLFIFTFLICITERQNLKDDPLNFNVLNIIVEVVSSYGNVGYSMGYSCKRRLNLDETCNDMWYGFSGRWSKQGKMVLMLVMFYGRLKKFTLQGGQGWHLT